MHNKYIIVYKDLTRFESIILVIFTILILFFGLYPDCILNLFHDFIYNNFFSDYNLCDTPFLKPRYAVLTLLSEMGLCCIFYPYLS